MKRHLLTSIGILILLISCKQKETQKIEIPEQKPTTELKAETEKIVEKTPIPEQYFESDSLRILLESDLEKLALNPKFDLKTEPRINTHNETITDTVKTQTFDKTKIYSYRAKDKEWIYAAKIRSSEFKFLEFIKIGVNKKTLENILKSELETDLIKIGDLENTSVFIFTFANDTLKTIDYQGWVD